MAGRALVSINRNAAPTFKPGKPSTGISHKKGAAKVTRLTQASSEAVWRKPLKGWKFQLTNFYARIHNGLGVEHEWKL